ncbi:MAG: signal peptidase I [Elusimicrobia bacterium RIFOXYA2_FULL_39_19]|nr:MAG: signal peptidase I [Elusimicrobia bacterium RIFOXYA2_FULL_39_19]
MHHLKKKNEKLVNSKVYLFILEWVDTIWSAVLFASVIMFFIIQAFQIPSGSMHNTLFEGDRLFANKFIYGIHIPFVEGKKILPFRKVRRGDVVIFKCPQAALSAEEKAKGVTKDFVKRAIGLAGDTIEIKNKKVFLNGQPIAEPYVVFEVPGYMQPKVKMFNSQADYQKSWEQGSFVSMPIQDNFGPVKVPEGCYFVMGDNRDRSFDSRFWGPMPHKNLKGQALVKFWPLTRIGLIK